MSQPTRLALKAIRQVEERRGEGLGFREGLGLWDYGSRFWVSLEYTDKRLTDGLRFKP